MSTKEAKSISHFTRDLQRESAYQAQSSKAVVLVAREGDRDREKEVIRVYITPAGGLSISIAAAPNHPAMIIMNESRSQRDVAKPERSLVVNIL